MERSVSLYVHVPFCVKRCSYCDFYSTSSRGLIDSDLFLKAIQRQLSVQTELFDIQDFSTVYIGGGTPSCLPPEILAELLETISPYISEGRAEVSMELNPSDIRDELLTVLKSSCLTRLSVGIQSLDETIRHRIGRRGTASSVRAAMDRLCAGWSKSLSVDCMYGLPGQDADNLIATLSQILEWPVQHISLYELTVETQTPLAAQLTSGEIRLPEEDVVNDSWFLAKKLLAAKGYDRYEVSNWALPGQTCRHNQHYWRLDDWLGLGPSAVGSRLMPDGSYIRYTNSSDLDSYLADPLVQGSSQKITGIDAQFEFLMMALRTRAGIDLAEAQRRYPLLDLENVKRCLQAFPGFFDSEPAFLKPTDKGLDLLNLPLERLLAMLQK